LPTSKVYDLVEQSHGLGELLAVVICRCLLQTPPSALRQDREAR